MEQLRRWVDRLRGAGESQNVEFKDIVREPGQIARTIAGMANANGGVILIGVRDDAVVIGLSEHDLEAARNAARIAIASVFPTSRSYAALQTVVYPQGAKVIAVEVDNVPDDLKPFRMADGAVYQRKGARNVRVVNPRRPDRVEATPKNPVQIFVAMSFQVEREPALVDYYEAIKRAAARLKVPHILSRVDEINGDYEITQKIEEVIAASDIVVADFTLSSPNVYYEAGIARGAGVYTIRLARKDTEIPFDIGNKKFILYSNATQLEEALINPLRDAYQAVREKVAS
ncbi:helix-turn-helix domain-containing protein [Streptomyces sp. NPDC127584]|uniref:AlbA family DNA-binding domain-containing protein n=1 Tax=Streptomyces sp. NPDC127584 TaxID=3345403 RepID=UPI003643EC22